jgi:GntR family galactonate operon transcriptional repressor
LSERYLYPSRGLHGQVAHQIGRRVVSGAIAEGDFLPRESDLSQQFSVSRQAVREALKVLAAKGLVQSRRRTGTLVLPRSAWNLLDPDVLAWHPPSRITPKFLADLVELRRVIEPAAAEFAAIHGDSAQIAAIGAALDAMRRSVDDVDAFHRADAEFHVAIFAASGNDLIDRLSTILRPLLDTSFPLQARSRVDFLGVVALHVTVYDAIVASKPVKARKGMQKILALASIELGRAVGTLVAPR